MKKVKKHNFKETEIAWLAGLLEGEGWFCLTENTAVAGVQMTDLDVIKKVSYLFGGNVVRPIKPREIGYKTAYRVVKKGKPAIRIMRLIYPFMGKRRRKSIRGLLRKTPSFCA